MGSEFQVILQLDALIQKSEVLIRLLDEARLRVQQLESENETLQNTLKDYQNQVKQLQRKPNESAQVFLNPKDLSKIVSDNPTNTVSNAEIKQKLDEYIREIDRCIAHLSSLS